MVKRKKKNLFFPMQGGRLSNGPQRCPILIYGTCKYVTIEGNIFTGVPGFRILRWEDYSDYLGGFSLITRVLIKRET